MFLYKRVYQRFIALSHTLFIHFDHLAVVCHKTIDFDFNICGLSIYSGAETTWH